MRKRLHTYASYSIACAITWLVALMLVLVKRPAELRKVGYVCGGWWLGWLSSTIARSVYPAPTRLKDRSRQ